ncbi:MAG: MATE family efflux transporter [Armatimonadetes bacterium]|nr:MATE family efflux transporter [Armatimonadota bacterium]MDW8028457.1 MATE family efflux transporter [Armatimonadota bacterium]
MGERVEAIAVRGDLKHALSVLAFPTLITQVTLTIGQLGETYFVKQLGDEAIAAIGAVMQVGWLFMVVAMMISTGATTLVAQRWGASDLVGARKVVTATLQQGLFFGFVLWMLWFFKDIIWDWLDISYDVRQLATIYFAALLLASPIVSIEFGIMSLYRGIGDMLTPMYSMLAGVLSQLVLCALLVLHLGIFGVGLAFTISRFIILVWLLARIKRSQIRLLQLQVKGWSFEEHKKLLAIGVPSGMQFFLWSLASMIYFSVLSHLGNEKESTTAIAALTAGLRIEALAFMPGIAFGIAAQTLVGQNIGAGQFDRARKGAWQAAFWCCAVMGVMALFFFIAADWLAAKFSNEDLTRRYIASYLRINAISEPFLGLSMTLSGALRGLGDALTPAIISVGALWVLRLPLTYILCHVFGYDAIAAWWAMSLSTTVSGVLTALAFWKKKLVADVKLR